MTECVEKCFKCNNQGKLYANISHFHRFCLTCIHLNQSSIDYCIHCSSIILISDSILIPDPDFQVLNILKSPIQTFESIPSLNPADPDPVLLSEPHQIPHPIQPQDEILPNHPEKFPCAFCNKFHESGRCQSTNYFRCDLCTKLKNEYLNEYKCEHKACASCFNCGPCTLCDLKNIRCEFCHSQGASLVDCGHIACASCKFSKKICKKCRCQHCGRVKKASMKFECGHEGCELCTASRFCFGGKCVKKNLSKEFGIVECYLCKIGKEKVMKMMCDHFLCDKCFRKEIGVAKFVCWDCRDRFDMLSCDKCFGIIRWEPNGFDKIKKACCGLIYCLVCYNEVKNLDKPHHCKGSLFSIFG